MKRSYLDYAMSVIVARALPDVRDGLKPVHRRILYAMKEGGYDCNRPFRKSARIVGDVMGKYHPHGDAAIYDAMVRMAQDFSMRLPLIDGQGNFGSMDGDPPAAMRYTEARLARAAERAARRHRQGHGRFPAQLRRDRREEPAVLPARFPNLLVNGAGGIAVGMATNIPPHNLGEVIDACLAYIDNPEITHRRADRDHARARTSRPAASSSAAPASARPITPAAARSSCAARTHDRGDPQGPRGDHRHRDPLPGEQGAPDRAHRRDGAREDHRGHLRPARRIRPRRRARRDRAEARRRWPRSC